MTLTPREAQVLELIAKGKKNREVAEILTIATRTAKIHRGHLFNKLGAHDVAGALREAIRQGLLPGADPLPPPDFTPQGAD